MRRQDVGTENRVRARTLPGSACTHTDVTGVARLHDIVQGVHLQPVNTQSGDCDEGRLTVSSIGVSSTKR